MSGDAAQVHVQGDRARRREELIAELAAAAAGRARRGVRLRLPTRLPVPEAGERP